MSNETQTVDSTGVPAATDTAKAAITEPTTGTVTAVEGTVTVTRDGHELALKAGDVIKAGDKITTGTDGRMMVEFHGAEGKQAPVSGVLSPNGTIVIGEQLTEKGTQLVVESAGNEFAFLEAADDDAAAVIAAKSGSGGLMGLMGAGGLLDAIGGGGLASAVGAAGALLATGAGGSESSGSSGSVAGNNSNGGGGSTVDGTAGGTGSQPAGSSGSGVSVGSSGGQTTPGAVSVVSSGYTGLLNTDQTTGSAGQVAPMGVTAGGQTLVSTGQTSLLGAGGTTGTDKPIVNPNLDLAHTTASPQVDLNPLLNTKINVLPASNNETGLGNALTGVAGLLNPNNTQPLQASLPVQNASGMSTAPSNDLVGVSSVQMNLLNQDTTLGTIKNTTVSVAEVDLVKVNDLKLGDLTANPSTLFADPMQALMQTMNPISFDPKNPGAGITLNAAGGLLGGGSVTVLPGLDQAAAHIQNFAAAPDNLLKLNLPLNTGPAGLPVVGDALAQASGLPVVGTVAAAASALFGKEAAASVPIDMAVNADQVKGLADRLTGDDLTNLPAQLQNAPSGNVISQDTISQAGVASLLVNVGERLPVTVESLTQQIQDNLTPEQLQTAIEHLSAQIQSLASMSGTAYEGFLPEVINESLLMQNAPSSALVENITSMASSSGLPLAGVFDALHLGSSSPDLGSILSVIGSDPSTLPANLPVLMTDLVDSVSSFIGVGGSSGVLDPVTSFLDPISAALTPVTSVLDPVTTVLDPVTSLLDPITSHSDPVTSLLDPVSSLLSPGTPTTDPVSALAPVLDPISSILSPVSGVITAPVDPVTALNPVLSPVLDPITSILSPVTGGTTTPVDPVTALTPVLDPITSILSPVTGGTTTPVVEPVTALAPITSADPGLLSGTGGGLLGSVTGGILSAGLTSAPAPSVPVDSLLTSTTSSISSTSTAGSTPLTDTLTSTSHKLLGG